MFLYVRKIVPFVIYIHMLYSVNIQNMQSKTYDDKFNVSVYI